MGNGTKSGRKARGAGKLPFCFVHPCPWQAGPPREPGISGSAVPARHDDPHFTKGFRAAKDREEVCCLVQEPRHLRQEMSNQGFVKAEEERVSWLCCVCVCLSVCVVGQWEIGESPTHPKAERKGGDELGEDSGRC